MARPANRPGNLPAEATSFIGRRRELGEVRQRLTTARLVSLVGPGGVGKTRLALRAATGVARRFPGGAWLVELAEVGDPALVTNAVMAALDLRDQAALEPRAMVLSYLRDKRMLLVVDNCEHLLPAVTRLADAVLKAAPFVRILATSREPLAVAGEHVVPVPPLDLPPVSSPLSRLRQNEAVLLFAERAVARAGRFELTAANQAAVVDLCRRLDGLPLAIELAAVRTRVLAPQQILDRLTDRFALLTGGGADSRQQTLRTTIDWSHDLLTTAEQAQLRRLCVFAGRFTLEDVEALSDAPSFDVLSSLVDKSLVLKEDVGTVATYRLHETMREYARLRLAESGETEAVESRWADYYRARCRQSAVEARYRLVEWLGWMELEIDNIRAVLQRYVLRADVARGLELTNALSWYWVTRATSEGTRWFDSLLASAARLPQPPGLAFFLRGFLAVLQYDPGAAAPVLERAVAAARAAGHVSLESLSLGMAAIAEHMAGDRDACRRLLAAADQASAGLGFPETIMLLQARTLTSLFDNDLATASAAAAEGVRLSREAGDLYSLEMMLLNLGAASLLSGDADGAEPLFTESLRLARELDDRVGQYCLLDLLACRVAETGRPGLAARLLGAAETVQASAGASVLPHVDTLIDRAKQSARSALGPSTFDKEFQAGQRLSRTAAIDLALGLAPAPDEAPSPPTLREREAQIAELVADGLSNKQIAAKLFLSPHTVDSHIRSIMNKLGCGSRAQIAAWMASSEGRIS
jgi:predicted ATPase/DNA-binding CsgD family transcriptional regulator